MRMSTRSGTSPTVTSRVFPALYAGITTAMRLPLIMGSLRRTGSGSSNSLPEEGANQSNLHFRRGFTRQTKARLQELAARVCCLPVARVGDRCRSARQNRALGREDGYV